MRGIVNSAEDMPKEYREACNESKKAFGDDQIFDREIHPRTKAYRSTGACR